MTQEDFAINLDTLPKLVLNEDKGRALLKHMLTVDAFKQGVLALKLASLQHHCEAHLEIKLPTWFGPEKAGTTREQVNRLTKEFPNIGIVWEKLSLQIDRHLFLFFTAYASQLDNLTDEDNKDFVDCGVYDSQAVEVAAAAFVAHGIGASASRKFGTDPIRTLIGSAKAAIASQGHYKIVLENYVKDTLGRDDYGKGTIYNP